MKNQTKPIKKFFLLLYLGVFITGCSKVVQGPSASLYSKVNILLKNEAGLNLLDPNTAGHLTIEKIHHYHMIDGEKVYQYHQHLEYPKRMYVHHQDPREQFIGGHFLVVYQNLNNRLKTGDIVTSIIEYEGGFAADTIQAEANIFKNSTSYSRIWVNGEDYGVGQAVITLIK